MLECLRSRDASKGYDVDEMDERPHSLKKLLLENCVA